MFVAPDGSDMKPIDYSILAHPDQWHVSPPEVEVDISGGGSNNLVVCSIIEHGKINLNNDVYQPTSIEKFEVPVDNIQFQHVPSNLEDELNHYLKK